MISFLKTTLVKSVKLFVLVFFNYRISIREKIIKLWDEKDRSSEAHFWQVYVWCCSG